MSSNLTVEDYKAVGAQMTVGDLIARLLGSPMDAGVFIGGLDYSAIDGLAPDREPVTAVYTVTAHACTKGESDSIAYVLINGLPLTEEQKAEYKAELDAAMEESEAAA